MAEDLRHGDPAACDVVAMRAALASECEDASRSATDTAATFYDYIKRLTFIRGTLWIAGGIAGICAAQEELIGGLGLPPWAKAGLALAAIAIPALTKALHLDEQISDFRDGAAKFKVAEGRLRRAADVWSHKPLHEFEAEAREAFAIHEAAQALSLTPPNASFLRAQKKAEDYLSERKKSQKIGQG